MTMNDVNIQSPIGYTRACSPKRGLRPPDSESSGTLVKTCRFQAPD